MAEFPDSESGAEPGESGAAPGKRGRVIGRWLAGIVATIVAGVATAAIANALNSPSGSSNHGQRSTAAGPGSPENLRGTGVTDTSLTIAWDSPTTGPTVVAYQVFRDGRVVVTQAARTYTDRRLTPLTTYGYSVKAVDAAGNSSAPSLPVTLETVADKTPPSRPSQFRVASRGSTSISVTWSPATDDVAVTGYVLHWTDSTVGTPNTVNTTSTSYAVTGLSPGHWISFDVAAKDGAGNVSTARSLQELTVSSFDFTLTLTAGGGPTACGYYSSEQEGVFSLQLPFTVGLTDTLPGADARLDLSSPYLKDGGDQESFGGFPPSGSINVVAEPLALISARGHTIVIHVEVDKKFRADETNPGNNAVDVTIPLPSSLLLDNGVHTLACS